MKICSICKDKFNQEVESIGIVADHPLCEKHYMSELTNPTLPPKIKRIGFK